MIDVPTYTRLQGIIRREGRSLLQYAADSDPWSGETNNDAGIAEVKRLADREREAYSALGKLLVANHLTPPWLGAFPAGFTSFNYLTMPRLAALLIRHQRDGIAALEADLPQVTHEEARAALKHLLEVKRQTLTDLEALAAPAQQAAKVPAAAPAAH